MPGWLCLPPAGPVLPEPGACRPHRAGKALAGASAATASARAAPARPPGSPCAWACTPLCRHPQRWPACLQDITRVSLAAGQGAAILTSTNPSMVEAMRLLKAGARDRQADSSSSGGGGCGSPARWWWELAFPSYHATLGDDPCGTLREVRDRPCPHPCTSTPIYTQHTQGESTVCSMHVGSIARLPHSASHGTALPHRMQAGGRGAHNLHLRTGGHARSSCRARSRRRRRAAAAARRCGPTS